MAGEAREKCAVGGIVLEEGSDAASALLYETLFAMQHRGPEATGMVSLRHDGALVEHRGLGMVRDVFNQDSIDRLAGSIACGHDRYSTNGSKTGHPQPVIDKEVGFAFSLNGNNPTTRFLENTLARRNIRTADMNDAQMGGMEIAQNIRSGHDLADSVELTFPLLRGAFSCVSMHDDTLVAFRDPKGIRPLALGKLDNGYAVASETCGLDIIDAQYEREVQPGEMIIITKDSIESRQLSDPDPKLDMFEFVYFARHDSELYGKRVNEVRRQFGVELAEQHPPITNDPDNIIVVPVPDTSTPAAEGYADALGLKHAQAIIKNRYIGRTFLQPSQGSRTDSLRRKHNFIPEAVSGKDVIMIDDSIVRLNTIPRLVKQAYECNAKSVTVLIASSPVRFPDYYGIDTPEQKELAAANMTIEEMRQQIECLYLGYLSLDRMIRATGYDESMFNLSCFTGVYPLDIGENKKNIYKPKSMELVE